MAFTTPRTWVAAEIVTAANMNTHVRDNMKAAAGADKAACKVYSVTLQTVATGTPTAIQCDLEYIDTQTMHSTVTNNTRITIPSGWGGIYLCGFQSLWAGTASTGPNFPHQNAIRINNTNNLALSPGMFDNNLLNDGVSPVTLNTLAAGDYIEGTAAQYTGGNLNTVIIAGVSPMFWAIWQSTG